MYSENEQAGRARSVRLEVKETSNEDDEWLESRHSFRSRGEGGDSSPSEKSSKGDDGSTSGSSATRRRGFAAHERKLIVFAFRLAMLEKSATRLGQLAFIWATVVLLGGFAVILKKKDFVYVTIILFTEGTRTFGGSSELQWRHDSTWAVHGSSLLPFKGSFRFLQRVTKAIFRRGDDLSRASRHVDRSPEERVGRNISRRMWRSPVLQLFPRAGWTVVSKNMSSMLILLQLLSAISCAVLSLMRLSTQDYGEVAPESKNRKLALNLFYGMALAAALMFLIEKIYWTWMISYRRLLEEINRDYELGPSGIEFVRRFFYDTYSKCINGSIFHDQNIDFVTFAKDLLLSESLDEQIAGAQVLQTLVHNDFWYDTKAKLETSKAAVEKLMEMLNWRNPDQEKMRLLAASIVSKLVGKRESTIRIAEIPGAMESISSLLQLDPYEGCRTYDSKYKIILLNLHGLMILKKLAYDEDNSLNIGKTRNLLSRIISFTRNSRILLSDVEYTIYEMKILKMSLQVLKLLVRTTGNTGKMLRQQICENVFIVSNIREIILREESHKALQLLGIKILTSLAMDDTGKETIGSTGEVIMQLLSIFFKPGLTDNKKLLIYKAGEAVMELTQGSKNNCNLILKEVEAFDALIGALDQPVLQIYASRILQNLCAYIRTEHNYHLSRIKIAMPTVLRAIMTAEEKLLKALVGLAIQICKHMGPNEFSIAHIQANIEEADHLIKRLILIPKRYAYPNIEVPRIRRFMIELAIWMMQSNSNYIILFKNNEMEQYVKHIAATTSELESFHDLSGNIGLNRHRENIYSLVETAIGLMKP